MNLLTRVVATTALATFALVGHAATQTGGATWEGGLWGTGPINGHNYFFSQSSTWAIDGGTFNLDSATLQTTDLIGSYNRIYAYGYTPTDTGSNYSFYKEVLMDGNEPQTVSFAFEGVDLVVFRHDTWSDGAQIAVSNLTGAGITPAVPEPESYAMMLAGLGITALAARRRRKPG